MTMKLKTLSKFCVVGFLVFLQACAGNPLGYFSDKPYFTSPQAQMTREDRELFDRALFRQENNRVPAAIKVWKQFLQKYPRSFEAHNNLGLVYFEDDQVDPSIVEFETALSLEPNDEKIKKNLIRVLAFKATLLREARDYNGAVDTLKRAQEVSTPAGKEKIGFRIEKYEDKVFEQAKQANTLEAYEGFLKRFPNSGKKADEARTKIAGLEPVRPQVSESALDGMQTEEPIVPLDEIAMPESDSAPEAEIAKTDVGDMGQAIANRIEDSVQESADKIRMDENASTVKDSARQMLDSTAEKVEAKKDSAMQMLDTTAEKVDAKKDSARQMLDTTAEKVDAKKESALQMLETVGKSEEKPLIESLDKAVIPERLEEAVRSAERPIEIATQPEPKPSTGTDFSASQEPPKVANLFEALEASPLPPKKIVEIVTRRDPLRVREGPSVNSRILATVAKGAQYPFVSEKNGWYQVEFSAGQSGWVSKKFARLVK
jgi:tetratricopeptide (TPR) repeat protein